MKLSEMITKLESLKKKIGDKNVMIYEPELCEFYPAEIKNYNTTSGDFEDEYGGFDEEFFHGDSGDFVLIISGDIP